MLLPRRSGLRRDGLPPAAPPAAAPRLLLPGRPMAVSPDRTEAPVGAIRKVIQSMHWPCCKAGQFQRSSSLPPPPLLPGPQRSPTAPHLPSPACRPRARPLRCCGHSDDVAVGGICGGMGVQAPQLRQGRCATGLLGITHPQDFRVRGSQGTHRPAHLLSVFDPIAQALVASGRSPASGGFLRGGPRGF